MSDAERLKFLMDYTKFHIGMYATLVGALIAVLELGFLGGVARDFEPFLWLTLMAFVVAGAAGGLVGSSISFAVDYDELMARKVGPWSARWLSVEACIHLEHTAFWVGILSAVVGMWFARF